MPYNLFPSLHIALGSLLVVTYARHTRGIIRAVVCGWFILIAASAVLTLQHHILDVVGGLALAGYCFYFVREQTVRPPFVPNRRIGCYYFAGAIVLGAAGAEFWPWGALLLWPAFAMTLVGAGYFYGGPAIFRKTDGTIPWSTCWALGPCLLGQHLSRLYYRRQCRAWDQVTPNVWIGRVLAEGEAAQAIHDGVTAVLDLTAEFSAPPAFRNLCYLNVPILDLTAPTDEQLETMVQFISKQAQDGVVYVHCKIGYSRSAAAIIGWLLVTGQVSNIDEGVARLRRVRPSIVVRPEIRRALARFESHRPTPA